MIAPRILCCILAALVVHSASGVDVASPAKRDQPIVITHDAGEVIQAIFGVYTNGNVEWSTLPDVHFARGETQTIMVAPPGDYVIVTGERTTVRVIEEGTPGPRPNPSPGPAPIPPDPQPEPTPNPIVDGVVWALIFEQVEDRSQNPEFAELMASGYLADLDARDDFEFRPYDIDSANGKNRAAYHRGVDLPALVLVKADGTKLDARTIRSEDDMRAAIKEVTGRE